MNRRDTELLAIPTVPAMRGSTSAYLRVETPRNQDVADAALPPGCR